MPIASSPQLQEVTSATFRKFVEQNPFVLVHFWASWNGNDCLMKRVLESQLQAKVAEPVAFAQVDVDRPENQDLCRQHNVLNVPFLALYRDGVLVRTLIGLRTPEAVSEQLRDLVRERAA